jgi:putative membrane protein
MNANAIRSRLRDHVPTVAALLSLCSLALVFGAALGAVPRALLPRAPPAVLAAVPHVNAAVSALAVLTIAGGVRAIRRGRVRRHRALMLLSTGLFATFLALYLYKVILQGPADFPGPGAVYRFVYLPLLGVHVLLAVVCIPLLYYVLLLAFSHPLSDLPSTRHPTVGRLAAALWVTSFVLGNVVYLLLYVVYG